MSPLPNCLLVVTAEVDAEVEADWSRWYDEVHLPDALACPGVLAGRRYASVGEISESDRGQGRRTTAKLWTTVYELNSPAAVDDQGICCHARLGPLRAQCSLADARRDGASLMEFCSAPLGRVCLPRARVHDPL